MACCGAGLTRNWPKVPAHKGFLPDVAAASPEIVPFARPCQDV